MKKMSVTPTVSRAVVFFHPPKKRVSFSYGAWRRMAKTAASDRTAKNGAKTKKRSMETPKKSTRRERFSSRFLSIRIA